MLGGDECLGGAESGMFPHRYVYVPYRCSLPILASQDFNGGVWMSEVIVDFAACTAFGSKIIYEDLNLTIHRGETLCIIGGSGTGKSVMMKMLVGLLRPDRGEILHLDEISKLSEKEMQEVRRNVAMRLRRVCLTL